MMNISSQLLLLVLLIFSIIRMYIVHSVVVGGSVGIVVGAGVVGIFTSDNDNNMKGIRYL